MKKFSSIRSIQILAHVLKEYEISDIVISPGSRNAPIAIHLNETEDFNCYSIVDERSAGFVALGMAQQTRKPVAVTCTSGSAAANYYPAVVEAFYQNTPLLLLTADRPVDFVDLFDGQTIRQKNLFQQHSYGDFELLEDDKENADEHNLETIKKAIELSILKQGPVHINIPLKEPLYHMVPEIPMYPTVEKTIQKKPYEIPSQLIAEWNTSKRIMILVGTREYSEELESQLTQLVKNHSVVVLKEVNSNLHHEKFFAHIDRYIFDFNEEDFKTYAPDLLITVGQNVVSKKVKQFLRNAQPKAHWHVDEFWHPDTYYSLTEKINASHENFFAQILKHATLEPSPYFNLWDNVRDKKDVKHNEYINKITYSDFYLFYLLSLKTPKNYHIHFSNSSAIRYGQLFDFNQHQVICNRGTSGIDGSTSTAMGYAIKNQDPTLLISGDLGFLYDINGLWNQYIPPFTRIIVFNNQEGNIFKFIPGPSDAKENILDEFIATKHDKTLEHMAKHFDFEYIKVENELNLDRVLDNFFIPDHKPKILEVMTGGETHSENILKKYFEYLKS